MQLSICLPLIDDQTETDADMDQDLKNSLKGISDGVSALLHHAKNGLPVPSPPNVPPSRVGRVGTILATSVSGVVLLGAMYSVVHYTVEKDIGDAFKQPEKDINSLQEDSKYLRRDVDELRAQHSTAVLNHPLDSSPQEVGEAADRLRKQGVDLPRKQVADAGQALLRNASLETDANGWEAATKVLAYISFLNSKVAPKIEDVTTPGKDFSVSTDFYRPPGWNTDSVAWVGASRPPDIPDVRLIADHHISRNSSSIGYSYIVFKGGTLKLDGLSIKRAIFTNAHIEYDGGPLSLKGVYFLN